MTDALREKLVQAGRALVSEDQGDYVAGRVTLRLPDGDGRFLMKPAGIGLEEMTPDNIIIVDADHRRRRSTRRITGLHWP
jgi:ribulose-5-phosphate 4-epimerase/fuculose-1-phosphate aldolase